MTTSSRSEAIDSVARGIAGPAGGSDSWHGLDVPSVAETLGVSPERGLDDAEVSERRGRYGPNLLEETKKEAGWQAFLRQYRDFMQIVLLAAAVINIVVTGDLSTTLLLLALTVFNAVLGLHQESKAEASLAALEKTMKTIARVRRNGEAIEVDAGDLVPGDIVLIEAGNMVPADGRLFVAATLEIEEAALTGESTPTLKTTDAIKTPELGLG
ncbi:MAG TPA: cation-transporting P-type ATPase, partial [Acidimicrobiia bacterium]|nr:cation-transporting P-type ATPase [Acidimicrobiia bacterium]